ncbi:MAG: hypothetical protein LBQ09_00920, partial [Acidobacteriaceae bacterium]|nr:hypothetical protein [Acidobacteriaceae bacterium]
MSSRNRLLLILSSVLAVATLACGGPNVFEIPIETPIQPKLDTTPFQRVLIVGFVAGGNDDVDANQETVRLLRSQLRNKSSLRVIDADPLQLIDIAQEQNKNASAPEKSDAPATSAAQEPGNQTAAAPSTASGDQSGQPLPLPQKIKEEKDLEPYERLFANTAYWRRLGEEYQNPLIVTGTVLFAPNSRSGFVSRDQETFDSFGRRRVVPVRTFEERKGYVLRPKFVFIDGRTGATLYS